MFGTADAELAILVEIFSVPEPNLFQLWRAVIGAPETLMTPVPEVT